MQGEGHTYSYCGLCCETVLGNAHLEASAVVCGGGGGGHLASVGTVRHSGSSWHLCSRHRWVQGDGGVLGVVCPWVACSWVML